MEMGELSLLAYHGRPRKRERKRDINVEVCGSWNFGKDWNFGKMEKLVACGGRKEIKEKEKGKEIHMRRYFLGLKK